MVKNRLNHIAIIGSTGLVGYEVTKKIIKNADYKKLSTASLNKKDKRYLLNKQNHFFGDFNNKISWLKILKSKPNVIVLISNCRHLLALEEAINSSNKYKVNKIKFIIVGTTGIFSPVKKYSGIYKTIEKKIKELNFEKYTILRPNLIYGSYRDKNISKVINFIRKYKFIPSLSGDIGKIQPLYYKDLVNVIIHCIYNKNLNGTFNITGKECLNYYDFYEEIFKALNQKKRIIKVPYKFSLFISRIIEFILGADFFINVERIKRLKEIKCFSNFEAIEQNFYKPTSFKDGIKKQIEDLNRK